MFLLLAKINASNNGSWYGTESDADRTKGLCRVQAEEDHLAQCKQCRFFISVLPWKLLRGTFSHSCFSIHKYIPISFLSIQSAEKDGGKLEVTHYHFTAWPDHGVPADKTCMLAFIKRIRKAHPPMGPPLLVHCSAGVGRTGTFITLDTMLQRMEDGQDLNVHEFVKQMRTKRVLMVQTEVLQTLFKVFKSMASSKREYICHHQSLVSLLTLLSLVE